MLHVLPGKKLYQQPCFDDFDHTKSQFISSLYPASCDTVEDRWDFIIQAFLALEELDFKTRFEVFMSRRKELDVSRYKLSLSEFLPFLECFYFCISTKDVKFSIKPDQKLKLLMGLKVISEGHICEPGILTRLHEMMIDLRSDSQWIPTELYRQRQSYLRMLGEDYNQSANVRDGYTIHTHFRMQTLASGLPLGLVSKEPFEDVYLNPDQRSGIDKFFQQHYCMQFKQYEQSCIDGLFAELWKSYQEHYAHRLEVTDGKIYFLDQVEMVHGKAQVTKCANHLIFDEFLKSYFGDEVNYTNFYDFDDDYRQTLVAEPDLKTAFRVALIEKMQIEGYLIDFSTPVNLEDIQVLGLSDALRLQLKQLLKEKDQADFKLNVEQYKQLLEKLPALLFFFITRNPALWYSVSKTVFSQDLVEKLICFIDDNYHKKFDVIIKQIAKLNQEYLKHFKKIDVSGYYTNVERLPQNTWFSLRYGHAEAKLMLPLDISPVAYDRFRTAMMRLNYNPAESGTFLEWKQKHLPSVIQKGDLGVLQESLRVSHHLYDALRLFQNKIFVKDCGFSSLSSVHHQCLTTLALLKKHLSMLPTLLRKTFVFFICWELTVLKWAFINFIIDLVLLSPTLFYILGAFALLSVIAGYPPNKFFNRLNTTLILFGLFDIRALVICGLNATLVYILPSLISKLSQLTPYHINTSDVQAYITQALRFFYLSEYDLFKSLIWEGILFVYAFSAWSKEVFSMLSSWVMRIGLTLFPKSQESPLTKLEYDIDALEAANDPFLNKKADLLLVIWTAMQTDLSRGDTLETLMERPYLVEWQGELQNLSFNQAREIKKESSIKFSWFGKASSEKIPEPSIAAQP